MDSDQHMLETPAVFWHGAFRLKCLDRAPPSPLAVCWGMKTWAWQTVGQSRSSGNTAVVEVHSLLHVYLNKFQCKVRVRKTTWWMCFVLTMFFKACICTILYLYRIWCKQIGERQRQMITSFCEGYKSLHFTNWVQLHVIHPPCIRL